MNLWVQRLGGRRGGSRLTRLCADSTAPTAMSAYSAPTRLKKIRINPSGRTRLISGSGKKGRISSGAKAHIFPAVYGTAEAVPSQKPFMRRPLARVIRTAPAPRYLHFHIVSFLAPGLVGCPLQERRCRLLAASSMCHTRSGVRTNEVAKSARRPTTKSVRPTRAASGRKHAPPMQPRRQAALADR